MTPEQEKLQEIFTEALHKTSPEERGAFLAAACYEDPEFREQVDSLIEAQAESGNFLRENVINGNGAGIGEGPGSIVGRYKLLQQIGEGGFGVVFMAEQLEPLRRMVALKILKPGMDTKEVVARFEAGRQALALMDHPHIARVLDGGATESGRPYFVMELVKGIPIVEFCDQRQLSIDERLRLFIKVCAGVQHAHQKGIIHRDLKPSNVLVTLHDGEPVPKVIDFGIAKAIGQKLTEKTLFTRFEQLIGTPAYMSPEQAEWSGLDIDTRSDIYSLGVLLYELLTSTTPLEKDTLARAALDEVRRMIRETDPPKPSKRLTALLTAVEPEQTQPASKTSLAEHTVSSPLHSARALRIGFAQARSSFGSFQRRLQSVRGDLDWIAMKALEKDRTRRYETVNGLAQDLERHMNSEPVSACPPSQLYRMRKFVRKHRIGVSGVVGVVLTLTLGLVLALLGFAEAKRERERARSEAETAKAVTDFLTDDLLGHANPFEDPENALRQRELLDRAAQRMAGRFDKKPLVEAAVRKTIADGYICLGDDNQAYQHLSAAVALFSTNSNADVRSSLDAKIQLINTGMPGRPRGEVEDLARRTCEEARSRFGPGDSNTLGAEHQLAKFYLNQGRLEVADAMFRRLLKSASRALGPKDQLTDHLRFWVAELNKRERRFMDAASQFEELLAGPHVPTLDFVARQSAGQAYAALGELPRSAALLRESVKGSRPVYGGLCENNFSAGLLNIEGGLGNWPECVLLCRKLLQPNARYTTVDPLEYAVLARSGAAAALLSSDTNAYHEFVSQALTEFQDTTNGIAARMVLQSCMLDPATAVSVPAIKMAELVATNSDSPADRVTRGIFEYRLGNLPLALKLLDNTRKPLMQISACQAGFFRAMIYHRQGNSADSNCEMTIAEQLFASLTRTGVDWEIFDVYARTALFRAEAERLIFGREISPVFDSTWIAARREQAKSLRQHLNKAARLGAEQKWPEARGECLAAESDPSFDEDSVGFEELERMAICLFLAGDHSNFQELCRRWFHRLERFPDPRDAYFAVRACLSGEHDGGSELSQLALTWASEATVNSPGMRPEVSAAGDSWVRAIAAYRSGQYDKAIVEAQHSHPGQRLTIRSAARVLGSMAVAKSGRWEEGKAELVRVENELGEYVKTLTGDCWQELALCRIALKEAHELFATGARQPPSASLGR